MHAEGKGEYITTSPPPRGPCSPRQKNMLVARPTTPPVADQTNRRTGDWGMWWGLPIWASHGFWLCLRWDLHTQPIIYLGARFSDTEDACGRKSRITTPLIPPSKKHAFVAGPTPPPVADPTRNYFCLSNGDWGLCGAFQSVCSSLLSTHPNFLALRKRVP
jgi:hypothetical protein